MEENTLHFLKFQKFWWQNFFLHWRPASWPPEPWLEVQVEQAVLPRAVLTSPTHQLLLLCTREPKWLKTNAGGRRGSCCPTEWVSWSSSPLGHEGSSWCEMGHRVGAGLGAGEEMSPFSLGQCWRMCALHYCLLPCGPSRDPSSPGRACTTGEMLSLLQNCYSLIVMEKKNKIRWTNFSWSWEEKACAISNLTANWTFFAVLSHQPHQQC